MEANEEFGGRTCVGREMVQGQPRVDDTMMGITQDLMKLDPTLSLIDCDGYKKFNTGGVEIEVGEFLY